MLTGSDSWGVPPLRVIGTCTECLGAILVREVMSQCDHCGAPLARSRNKSSVCSFCEQPNSPLPDRVEVPVPVQIVQNVVHVSEASQVAEVRCPHCRSRLVSIRVEEVELAGCGGCGGIWVDNGSARSVLESPRSIFSELARRAGANARHRGRRQERAVCAACPALLNRVRTHGVELDVCSEHGTWFDAYELEHLVVALKSGVTPKDFRPRDTRAIKCAGCKQDLTADRANLSDEGLVCESCWRVRLGEIIEAGDKKAREDGIAAVGGVLLGVALAMLGGGGSSANNG